MIKLARKRKKISFKGKTPEEIHKLRQQIVKSNKSVGKSVEHATVTKLRKAGIWAIRISSSQQKGENRGIDVIAAVNPMFFQGKRRKNLLDKEEKERLFAMAKKYNGKPFLSYRDRGIHLLDLETGLELALKNESLDDFQERKGKDE